MTAVAPCADVSLGGLIELRESLLLYKSEFLYYNKYRNHSWFLGEYFLSMFGDCTKNISLLFIFFYNFVTNLKILYSFLSHIFYYLVYKILLLHLQS